MITAIDIACPRCLARPGDDCLPAGRTHQERFTAAERRREDEQRQGRIVVEDPDANPVMAGLRSLMRATGYGAQADKLVAPEGKGEA